MDLFEHYKKQPKKLQKICDKYMAIEHENGCLTYNQCKKFLYEVEKIGFTFEYGLDSQPYEIKKMFDKKFANEKNEDIKTQLDNLF